MKDAFFPSTRLLDLDHPSIQGLVAARGWRDLEASERIGAVYDFVRDEIAFGYNESDDLPASRVLADGYGQCNTKSTLLMALLRAVGIATRLHGGTVHKRLQKGVVPALTYLLAPAEILHSWVEVRHEGRWIALEGVILDAAYLDGVRGANPRTTGAFLGYGVGTTRLGDPGVAWTGDHTFVQATGLARDLGTFADPDAFYRAHGTNLGRALGWLFRRFVRHAMNRKVARIRAGYFAVTLADACGPGCCRPAAAAT
jgi:transglutaminase-like putative cysteine protease